MRHQDIFIGLLVMFQVTEASPLGPLMYAQKQQLMSEGKEMDASLLHLACKSGCAGAPT